MNYKIRQNIDGHVVMLVCTYSQAERAVSMLEKENHRTYSIERIVHHSKKEFAKA